MIRLELLMANEQKTTQQWPRENSQEGKDKSKTNKRQ